MNNINVPSYNSLLPKDRHIRAIQDLYDYISRWKKELDESISNINTAIDKATNYRDVYIGVGSTYSDVMIEGNHQDVLRIGAMTPITADNEYLWVILPEDYNPTILMNGATVPMDQQENVTVGDITYKVFKSGTEYTSTFDIILI